MVNHFLACSSSPTTLCIPLSPSLISPCLLPFPPLPPTSIPTSMSLPFICFNMGGQEQFFCVQLVASFLYFLFLLGLFGSKRKEDCHVIHVSKRDQRLQGSLFPLVCLAFVLVFLSPFVCSDGSVAFRFPVLSSLFPSLSLSQPDYCRVYGPPR